MTEFTSVSGRASHSPAPPQMAPVPLPLCGPRPRGGSDPQRFAAPPNFGSSAAVGYIQTLLLATLALGLLLVAHVAPAAAFTFGEPGSGDGQLALSESSGVAANDATHHVYVADTNNYRVVEFTSSGGFVRAWGADVGGPGVDVCTTGCVAGASENAPGGFVSPRFIAVDNSGGVSNGAVYVADVETNLVSKFAADGTLISSWGVGGQLDGSTAAEGPFAPLAGIAVDDLGNLNVLDTNSRLFRFAEDGSFVTTFLAERGSAPVGLGIDSAGNLYKANGNLTVEKFTDTGVDVGQLNESEFTTGLAGDRATSEFYVARPDRIEAFTFTPSGEVLGSNCTPASFIGCNPTYVFGTGDLSNGAGIAVDSDSHTAYVADAGVSQIVGFPGAPEVSAASAGPVSGNTATVQGTINPGAAETTYKVNYGLTEGYGQSTPVATIPGNRSDRPVSVTFGGLQNGSTYHWRLVATNALGTSESPDRTFTTQATLNPTSCPNGGFRVGPSALLPDCRAYEMVSPVDKNGSAIASLPNAFGYRAQRVQASVDGEKFTYSSFRAFTAPDGAPYAVQFMSDRGPDGWTNRAISPRKDGGLTGLAFYDLEAEFRGFSADLSTAWLLNRNSDTLTADAAKNFINLYERDDSTGTYTAITNREPLNRPEDENSRLFVLYEGSSADGEHVLLTSNAPLLPETAQIRTNQLYEFSEGKLHLVSVLPNGDPVGELPNGELDGRGASAGTANSESELPRIGGKSLENAISDDGSRIFWTAASGGVSGGEGRGDLYLRVNNQETIPIATGKVAFRLATPSGDEVLYETSESQTNSPGELYRYDVATASPELIAGEEFGVLGASEDLQTVYFVSKEALASGATSGGFNLYVTRDSTVTWIAELSEADVLEAVDTSNTISNVSRWASRRTARVTPDGNHVAFMSTQPLKPGYDNADRISGEPAAEIYLYSADSDDLTCVSCNPAGVRPEGQPLRFPFTSVEEPLRNPTKWGAAWLTTAESSYYLPRALSDDGQRLFFNSYDALVAADTNGQQDVYEWEADGIGSCRQSDGCVFLISSGKSGQKSEFVDADPAGTNVFFETTSSLVGQDPGLNDIYVARVGGGFTPPSAPRAECEGDLCQIAPSSPGLPVAGSAAFSGSGNVKANLKKHKKRKQKKKMRRKHRHTKQKSARSCHGRAVRHSDEKWNCEAGRSPASSGRGMSR
jgi:sugar lactone lactonase YvrE